MVPTHLAPASCVEAMQKEVEEGHKVQYTVRKFILHQPNHAGSGTPQLHQDSRHEKSTRPFIEVYKTSRLAWMGPMGRLSPGTYCHDPRLSLPLPSVRWRTSSNRLLLESDKARRLRCGHAAPGAARTARRQPPSQSQRAIRTGPARHTRAAVPQAAANAHQPPAFGSAGRGYPTPGSAGRRTGGPAGYG